MTDRTVSIRLGMWGMCMQDSPLGVRDSMNIPFLR